MILELSTSTNDAEHNRVEAPAVASSVPQVKNSHTIAHWDIHLLSCHKPQCDNPVSAHLRSDELSVQQLCQVKMNFCRANIFLNIWLLPMLTYKSFLQHRLLTIFT